MLPALFLGTPAIAAASYSSFTLPGSNGKNDLEFALNVPQDGDDLFFRLSGTFTGSWMAVGFGREMAGSFIMIAYANADKTSK